MQLDTINPLVYKAPTHEAKNEELTPNDKALQLSKLTRIYLNLIDDLRTIVDEYLLDRRLINQLRVELQDSPKIFGTYRCIIAAQNLHLHGTEEQKMNALNYYYYTTLESFNDFLSEQYNNSHQFYFLLKGYLEEHGVIPNEYSLFKAVVTEDISYLNILLKFGGKPECEGENQSQVIVKIMEKNQKNIIEKFIEFNVSPIRFLRNISSQTQISTVNFIIDKGAVPDKLSYQNAIIYNKEAIPLYLNTSGVPCSESIILCFFYPWNSETETNNYIKRFIIKGAIPNEACLKAAEQFNKRTLLEQWVKLKRFNLLTPPETP